MWSSPVRGGALVVATLVCACALAVADPPAALAACGSVTTASWSAPGSGDWSDGGNWSTGVAPDACTDVTISAANPPLDVTGIPVGAAVHALSLGAGVRLSGGTLDAATLTWASSASAFDNHLATDLTVAGSAILSGDGVGFVDRVGGHGSLTLAGATSQLSWGTLQLSGGATLAVGGSLTVNASSLIEGATTGTVEITGGLVATGGATVQVHAAIVDVAGTLATPAGDLVLDSDETTLQDGASIGGAGTVTLQGTPGATSAPGAVHLNGTAVLRLDAGTLSGAGALTGSGALAWRGGHLGGSLTVGNLDVAGPGDKHLDDGATLTTSAASTWTGSTVHGAGAELINTGVVSGDAALELQTLTNHDVVAPAGQLTLDGDYVQQDGALLDVDIAADHHDRLLVTGSATLAGGVRPVTAAEYRPPIGASFTVLEYASRSGALSFIEDDIVGDDREYALDSGATATALNVVEGGGPSFAVSDATTAEHGSVTIPITLSPANGSPVSIHVATADGTAKADADYTATAADLTFAAGETTKTIEVPIADDTADEPDETFSIRLSNPSGAWVRHAAATVTITDDDEPAAGPVPIVAGPNTVITIAKPPPTTVLVVADDVCANPQVLSIGSARVRGCFTGSGALKTAQGKIDVDGIRLEPSSGTKLTVDTGSGEVRTTNGGTVDAVTYDPLTGARVVLGTLVRAAGPVVMKLRESVRAVVTLAQGAKVYGMRLVSLALLGGQHVGEMLIDAQVRLPALLGGLTARVRLLTDAVTRRIQQTGSTLRANLAKLANFGLDDLDLHLTQAGFEGTAKFRFANIPFAASIVIDLSGTVRDAHVTGSGSGAGRFRVNDLDLHAYELDGGQRLIGSLDVSDASPDGRRGITARGGVSISWPQGSSWTATVPSATVSLGGDTLVNASFAMGPTSASFAGSWSLDDAALRLHASAAISGWTTFGAPFAFEGFGSGNVAIPGFSAGGDAVTSSAGVGACAGITVGVGSLKRTIRVGFTFPAGNAPTLWFADCDLGPVRVAKTARVAQAAGASFAVSGRPDAALLAVHGSGGAPAPVLGAPGGQRVEPVGPGASVPSGGAMAFPDAASSTTYVLLAGPAAGRWTITPAAGTPAIARVETAEALAQPRVTAKVGGRGARRTLRWTAALAPGDRVRFVEEAGDLHHVLGTVGARSGSLVFTPAEGPAGTRRITALVERAGIPRASLEAGAYRATLAPLPAPRRVAVRRRARTLAVSWAKVRGADHYEAAVRIRGRQPATVLVRGRSLDLPAVAASAAVTVRVRAVTALDHAGRARTAKLRPAKARKRRR